MSGRLPDWYNKRKQATLDDFEGLRPEPPRQATLDDFDGLREGPWGLDLREDETSEQQEAWGLDLREDETPGQQEAWGLDLRDAPTQETTQSRGLPDWLSTNANPQFSMSQARPRPEWAKETPKVDPYAPKRQTEADYIKQHGVTPGEDYEARLAREEEVKMATSRGFGVPSLPTDVEVDETSAYSYLHPSASPAPAQESDTRSKVSEAAALSKAVLPQVAPTSAPKSNLETKPNFGLGAETPKQTEGMDLSGLPVTDYTPKPATDWTARLQAAKGDDERRMAMVEFLRSGSNLGQAIYGGKPDAGKDFYDRLGAPRATSGVEAEMGMETLAQKALAAKEETDPSSRTNRAAQQAFADYLSMAAPAARGRITQEQIAGMTRKQIEQVMGSRAKLLDSLEKERHNRAQENISSRTLDIRDAELGSRDALGRGNLEHKQFETVLDALIKKGNDPNAYREDVNRGKVAGFYGNFLNKVGKPTLDSVQSIVDIDRVRPGFSSGVVTPEILDQAQANPGIMNNILQRAPKGVGSNLLSMNEHLFNTARNSLQTIYQHQYAGANLTPQEVEIWNNIFGSNLLNSPEQMAIALDFFRRRIGQNYEYMRKGEKARSDLISPGSWDLIEDAHGFSDAFGILRNPSQAPVGNRAPQAPRPQQPRPQPQATTPAPAATGQKFIIRNKTTGKAAPPTSNQVAINRARENPDLYVIEAVQ